MPSPGPVPIFFLHIPKTSGSGVNALLQELYGAEATKTHIESVLPRLLDQTAPVLRARCVTGHVPLWSWVLYPGSEAYGRVTMLRDPWERLVSHINWVHHYHDGPPLPTHGQGAPALARIVALTAETDFEDRRDLQRYFDAVSREEHFSSFDNYQVRMLRSGHMEAMTKPIEPTDVTVARADLSLFIHFGFCDDQEAFQMDLARKLGVSWQPKPAPRVNPAQSNVLSVTNDLAAEVFMPWIWADSELVNLARRTKGRRAVA